MNKYLKRAWKFFWHEDSVASWIANIVVAFLVIRYIVYPLLAIVLGTGFPIVAVISESMEHGTHKGVICGQSFKEFSDSFDNYWDVCGYWYEENGITKEEFKQFPFSNGFYKGDVIILWRADKSNLIVGDILVFQANKPQPIIHRIVKTWQNDADKHFYQTKGDHNSQSISNQLGETEIGEERVLGQGIIRIPYLGWVKILFVNALSLININIET
jgi:signal peptidase I